MRYLLAITIVLSASSVFAQSHNPFLEERVSILEKQVKGLGESIERLEKHISVFDVKAAKCDCGTTGKCVCPDDAPCPDCGCPDCPCKAPVKVAKDVVTGEGTEILFFTADWCDPCKRAKAKLGDLYDDSRIKEIDFDRNKAMVNKYGVTAIPTAILTIDGVKANQADGWENAGSPAVINSWLNRTNSVVNRPQSTNQFVTPQVWTWNGQTYQRATMPTVRYQSYQPRVYFRQSSGYCPTCR